jgi:hypothetical protein
VTRRATSLALFVLCAAGARAQDAPTERFLRQVVGLDAAQLAAVERGAVVVRPLPSGDPSEVAAFGVVKAAGDPELLLRLSRDVRRFRKGPRTPEIGVLGTPPRVQDLAGLTLPPDDVAALRRCRPGACDVKLGTKGLERVAAVDWAASDAAARASAILDQGVVDLVAAYQQGGVDALGDAVDKRNARSRAAEYRALLGSSPYLFEYVQELADALSQYPRKRLPGAEDAFYWTKDTSGPKPVVSAWHQTAYRGPRGVLVANRLLAATHFFNAALDVTAVVPAADGNGIVVLTLYRARLDPPTGVLAPVLMGKVRDGAVTGVRETLENLRARLAAAR